MYKRMWWRLRKKETLCLGGNERIWGTLSSVKRCRSWKNFTWLHMKELHYLDMLPTALRFVESMSEGVKEWYRAEWWGRGISYVPMKQDEWAREMSCTALYFKLSGMQHRGQHWGGAVEFLLGMTAFLIGVPVWVLADSLSIHLPGTVTGIVVEEGQVLGTLPHTYKTGREFQVSGFGHWGIQLWWKGHR